MTKTLWTILIAACLGLAMGPVWADNPTPAEDPQPEAERPAEQDPPPAPAGAQLSHAQEQELLEVIQRRFPHRYEQLTELRDSNPDRYRQVMARWYRRYEQWQAMGPDIQRLEMARQELEIQSTQLVQRWRQAADNETKQQVEAQLRQVLTKRFDIEHDLHAKRLEHMAEQLEQLRREHAERAERRSEIIQQELNSLLRSVPRPGRDDSEDEAATDRPPRGPAGRTPRPGSDQSPDEQVEDDSQAQD